MQDYYLSFPDEAAANAVLFTQVPTAWDNSGEEPVATEWEQRPNFTNISVIGTIFKNEQAIEGWHVNVRLMDDEDGSSLEQFKVAPVTPFRVWG